MATSAKLHSIQILRFIAATSVVIAHATLGLPASADRSVPLRPDFLGAAGVVIFFLVSGFIMIHSTRGRFGTPGASADFLGKRIIRIVPIYWLASLAALSVVVLGSGRATSCDQVEPVYLASSFLFLAHARCDGEMQPILAQGWTLNYEALFYLAFAAAMTLRRGVGCLALGAFFALLAVSGMILRASIALRPDSVAGFYTDPLVMLFIGGVAAALIHERIGPARRAFVSAGVMVVATLAALLLIDVFVPYSSDYDQPHRLTWIVASLIFVAFAFQDFQPRRVVTPLLELCGDASYSVYLIHIFTLLVTKKIWTMLHLDGFPLAFIGVGTLLTLGAGIVVHVWIERPLVAALRRRANVPGIPVEFRAE